MADLVVHIPPEMEPYRADLQFFVSTMVRKLHVNRHKGVTVDLDIGRMLDGVIRETKETQDALGNADQFQFGVECADVANFAFLAACAAWAKDRRTYNEERNAS